HFTPVLVTGMAIEFLLKGLGIGFTVAASVGPIGVLCIRRTLAEGRLAGLVTGLGAATADALYALVAASGLSFGSQALPNHDFWLRLIGGVFLCFLGVRTVQANPVQPAVTVSRPGRLGAYASTLFFSLAGPATILTFAAIFAALGLDLGG